MAGEESDVHQDPPVSKPPPMWKKTCAAILTQSVCTSTSVV